MEIPKKTATTRTDKEATTEFAAEGELLWAPACDELLEEAAADDEEVAAGLLPEGSRGESETEVDAAPDWK